MPWPGISAFHILWFHEASRYMSGEEAQSFGLVDCLIHARARVAE